MHHISPQDQCKIETKTKLEIPLLQRKMHVSWRRKHVGSTIYGEDGERAGWMNEATWCGIFNSTAGGIKNNEWNPVGRVIIIIG